MQRERNTDTRNTEQTYCVFLSHCAVPCSNIMYQRAHERALMQRFPALIVLLDMVMRKLLNSMNELLNGKGSLHFCLNVAEAASLFNAGGECRHLNELKRRRTQSCPVYVSASCSRSFVLVKMLQFRVPDDTLPHRFLVFFFFLYRWCNEDEGLLNYVPLWAGRRFLCTSHRRLKRFETPAGLAAHYIVLFFIHIN